VFKLSITVNIYYTGENGNAKKFAQEMVSSRVVDAIRSESGNIKYEYYFPMEDTETVLLIDSWKDQHSIDLHHGSPMMGKIIELRDKYSLSMRVERYVTDSGGIPETDKKFIR
jgi:quinol monooxygenase YgiN